MKYIDTTCPNCGAQAHLDAKRKKAFCEYCGTELLLDDEVQRVAIDDAEEAGYQFEKGRQRAQREAGRNYNNGQTSRSTTQPRKKKKTWLWVLGWIFIFPIPATILIVRNKKLSGLLKGLLIALCWIVYLMIGSTGGKEASTAVDEGSAEGISINPIDYIVDQFNVASNIDLVYVEDFTPSDKESGHYRTEFRLNAYSNAIGKSYKYEERTVDIISTSSTLGKGNQRIYVSSASLNQCAAIIQAASPVMDPTASQNDIQEAINYILERKEANGYYYAKLGLLLLGNENSGYNMMIKTD